MGLEQLRCDDSFAKQRATRFRIVRQIVGRDVGGEHRDGSALLGPWRAYRRRLDSGGRLQRRVTVQDGALQLLQRAARLGAKLVDEGSPGPCVRLERVSLPPGAVERDDQLAAEALTVRLSRDELLELRHDGCMPAKREIRLDPLLECRQPEVLEWRGGAGWLAGEIRKRRAAPERQRLGKALGCNGRLGAPRVIDQTLKTVEVALALGDA